PLRILSSTSLLTTEPVTAPPGVTRFNWPIFSSSVIFFIRLLMKSFILLDCAFAVNEQIMKKTKRVMFGFFMILGFYFFSKYGWIILCQMWLPLELIFSSSSMN